MTPLGEAYRQAALLTFPGSLCGRTDQDAEPADGGDTSGLNPDDEGPTRQTSLQVAVSGEDDPGSDDEEHAEKVKPQDEAIEANNINQTPPTGGFVPFPRTRSLAQFHTISSGAPVLNSTPVAPARISSSFFATIAPPSQASSSTSPPAISSLLTTAAPSITPDPDISLSSTLSAPAPPSLTGVSTEASNSPSTQASAESSPAAAAVGGINGGQIAGATVGGAGERPALGLLNYAATNPCVLLHQLGLLSWPLGSSCSQREGAKLRQLSALCRIEKRAFGSSHLQPARLVTRHL